MPINPITNRSTCVAQTHLISESENIKETEIFYQLDIWCQDKPVFVREFLTEQIRSAIKLFEYSNMPVHIYLPVKNIDSPPDFLLTLLKAHNKSEKNLVVLHTLSEHFIITSESEKLAKKDDVNNSLSDLKSFCTSIINYAEIIGNDKFKMMADILAMEICLSAPDLHESNFFDFPLLEIDIQRMTQKNYFYHLFSQTDNIFDVFRDKKFHDFANSSSSQAEFNFIFGKKHSTAVICSKKDDKFSFIAIDGYKNKETISIKDFQKYCGIINENKSSNTKEALPNLLMNASNLKIINLGLKIQADPDNCRIFARDSLFSFSKDLGFLDEITEKGKFGESLLFNRITKTSVMDIVKPSLVRFSQRSYITDEYKKSFAKRNVLDMNVRKNKSNEPQTWEQYRSEHSRNEKIFNPVTKEVETKLRNKGAVDKRIKLLTDNINYLYAKLNIENIDNKEMQSYL